MSEDEAAGLRKQLIRFHCISCDRPIDVQPHPFVVFRHSRDARQPLSLFQTATEFTRQSGYASNPVTPTVYNLRTGPDSPISKEVRSNLRTRSFDEFSSLLVSSLAMSSPVA